MKIIRLLARREPSCDEMKDRYAAFIRFRALGLSTDEAICLVKAGFR